MIRLCYTALVYLLLPLVTLRLILRAGKSPDYAGRFRERFGLIYGGLTHRPHEKKGVIWLHAVSVGETLAAVPLIKALQKKYPTYRLMVTCMTPTGSQRIQAAFGDSVDHSYAPYDMPDAVARFLNRVEPELLIIMETELWPNTIAACRRRNIPVILANARLSEKSARGYQKIAPLVKPMLQSMDAVVAQHQDDGARFIDLGLPEQALSISGNIKFDLTLDAGMHNQAQQLSQAWRGHPSRPIWLAASTHRGEDEIILRAHRQMVEQLQQPPLLVLVPRHPERFDAVENLCRSAGFEVARRSHTDLDIAKADILLGDTMGELMLFYGACDLAFVGGSLVPNGGHNMIEPAAWGVPILTGPHLFNFSDVSQLLIRGGGMKVCDSDTSLAAECLGLLQNAGQRQAMGEAAQQVVEANRGALLKLLATIECQLPVNPCS